ncbi:PQQ-binding-like beta-propeller repeat protein [Halogranum amylolyticum]|uniref:PQQ-binding-like beta-propeller repeat protein n=1 Tax=Halogranum amylolyticum TaxID=660520 RepID=UPI001FCD2393|nr:PQQ-binding-like beta-propeller repeat protein [Halogranum amylolyticum]
MYPSYRVASFFFALQFSRTVVRTIPRRKILQKFGVAGAVVIAGCTETTSDEPTTSVGDTPKTANPTPTQTAEPTAKSTQTATPEESPCREPESRMSRWRTTTDSRTYDPVVADGIVYVGGDEPERLRVFCKEQRHIEMLQNRECERSTSRTIHIVTQGSATVTTHNGHSKRRPQKLHTTYRDTLA